ncbi:hypothetical protein VTK73DRAFT_2382 [Phialemonium thermophilum]|uniref:Uncharacterized protein n=1 Tax=Phialemonium thermophilum TaxID=223376 RepID=A0ABR3X578_9PEZI
MLFPEEDAPLLKAWIVKRLENTSDADADVLAEYVLALLRHDGSVEDVRKLCEEEIPDFLKEDSSIFVSDVFDAIKYKLYLPGAVPPPKRGAIPGPPAIAQSVEDVPMSQAPPTGPSHGVSRKRQHDQGDVDMQGRTEGSAPSSRPYKQARRGGGRGGRMQQDHNSFGWGQMAPSFFGGGYQQPQLPPRGTPGVPAFDPNNATEALMRLQQSMGLQMPPLPDFSSQAPLPQSAQSGRRRPRCRDYDTKGYCARGNSCMFEHGTDSIFVPPHMPPLPQPHMQDEYDPNNASIFLGQPNGSAPPPAQPFSPSGRGRQFGQRGNRHGAPRRGRASFSAEGPVNDKTKSTIVVENIPEERFSEEEVRGFFSQFGNIVEVSMKPYKHLAIVKYDSWAAANAAYRSPKVIFDNRFVKVYWYKEEAAGPAAGRDGAVAAGADAQDGTGPRAGSTGRSSATPRPEIDLEEFKRKQEEAQKAYQEKMQKVQEIERQREELEKRQKELLAKQQEERERLKAKLAAAASTKKEGSNGDAGDSSEQGENGTKHSQPSSKTEALRAQLAALEAEAMQLGLNTDAADESASWSSRGGRGRGRGGFIRARGYAPRGFRGAVRGRGGYHAAYAAYSIDNRPRRVAVAGVDFTVPEKDEMLRQYLFGIGEVTDIKPSPTSTVITFKDRKTAEKFFHSIANKEIPGVGGPVELSWVANENTSSPAASASGATDNPAHAEGGHPAGSASFNEQQEGTATQGPAKAALRSGGEGGTERDAGAAMEPPAAEQTEMDYDVADDSQWDIG